MQCIRRYWDTGNKFPHLLNCGKYIATIVFYVSLSVYRIDKNVATRAAFITFATINSIYTSFWDIYYDWSLGDMHAKHRFLRKELGYKKIWWYYTAIVIDPILRFNWILYAIIPLQIQHSAVTSFGVATSEICRRGMWSLFRVENEHCTNVGRFRASRDVPLPYYVPSPEVEPADARAHPRSKRVDEEQPAPPRTPGGPAAPATTSTASGLDLSRSRSSARRRAGATGGSEDFRPSPLQRAFTNVGDIFRDAHAQDFERKRKPELGRDPRENKVEDDDDSDDSDGEEEHSASAREGSVHGSGGESEEEAADDEEESALSRIREDLGIGMAGRDDDVRDV